MNEARRLLFDVLGGIDAGYKPPNVELAKLYAQEERPHHAEARKSAPWSLHTPVGYFSLTPDWTRVAVLGAKDKNKNNDASRRRANTDGSSSANGEGRQWANTDGSSSALSSAHGGGRQRAGTRGTFARSASQISEDEMFSSNQGQADAYHTLNKSEGVKFTEHFGLGISLYMKTLKYLAFQFMLMTLLNLPAIATYLTGQPSNELFMRLTLASLFVQTDDDDDAGNLGGASGGDGGGDGGGGDGGDATFLFGMGISDATSFLAWWDVVVVVFYVISTLWLAHRQYEDSVLFDVLGTTVGDYSIVMNNLPDGATNEDIAKLADDLANKAMAAIRVDDPVVPGPSTVGGELTAQQAEEGDVKEESHVGFVTIHYDCADLIQGYMEQEEVLRQVQEQHAVVCMLRSQDGVREGNPRLAAAEEKFNTMADKYYLATKAVHIASLTHPHPHAHPHRWMADWLMQQKLAQGSPMSTPPGSRVSSRRKPGTHEHFAHVAGIPSDTSGGDEDVDVASLPERRKICAFVTYRSDEAQKAVLEKYGGYKSESCFSLCPEPKSEYEIAQGPEPDDIHFGHLGTPPCEKFARRSISVLVTLVVLFVTAAIILFLKIWETDVADYYGSSSAEAELKLNGINFAYSVVVTVLNRALQHTLEGMSLYEHHHLKSLQAAAVVWRSSIALTLNSVVVLSLVEWDLGIPFTHLNDDGENLIKGFDEKWYEHIGSLITLTMVINAISQPAFTVVSSLSTRLTQWMNRSTVHTQFGLNQLYRGNRMVFIVRYSTILMTVFICFGLGAAMPILYPIGGFTFFAMFLSDYYCLLRVYRKPEKRFLECALLCSKAMLFAAPLHLCLTIAMLEAPLEEANGVVTGWCTSHSCSMLLSKVIRSELSPLVLLLFIVVGVLLMLFLVPKSMERLLSTCFIYGQSLKQEEDCPPLEVASESWAAQIESSKYEYLSTSYEYGESLPTLRRDLDYHKRNPYLKSFDSKADPTQEASLSDSFGVVSEGIAKS